MWDKEAAAAAKTTKWARKIDMVANVEREEKERKRGVGVGGSRRAGGWAGVEGENLAKS